MKRSVSCSYLCLSLEEERVYPNLVLCWLGTVRLKPFPFCCSCLDIFGVASVYILFQAGYMFCGQPTVFSQVLEVLGRCQCSVKSVPRPAREETHGSPSRRFRGKGIWAALRSPKRLTFSRLNEELPLNRLGNRRAGSVSGPFQFSS